MVVLGACAGGAALSPATQNIAFTDHGTTQQSGNDGGPRIVAAANAQARTELAALLPTLPAATDRVYIGAFAGSQRTGGYALRVDAVERTGDRLVVRATFTAPPSDAITIQVLTSPAHLVSIPAADAAGVREVVLIDQSGAERARGSVTQSRP